MRSSDPAYALFVDDARRLGYSVLADYFRDYGIVPPANHGRPKYKDREFAQHDDLERLAATPTHTSRYSIYKSWGEPGQTITVTRNGGDGDDDD